MTLIGQYGRSDFSEDLLTCPSIAGILSVTGFHCLAMVG